MSNIYIQEPPTSGKVVIKTSVGDIDLELWTKEAPKASRNFIQLCMEGYYDNTIFHRVVKGFIIQGGDPTGTGEGGESIYGHPFKDEFHSRLRFCRRGLLAMANAGKDDNGSQFFFTLGATPELQNKHTIFGKVTGETVYNMLKLEEALVDKNERPLYPQKIIKTEVLNNPFQDIVPRVASKKSDADKEKKSEKKSGVKNFKLLSFGEEAEEDEEESVVLNKQFIAKGKSAHDTLSDPKLSSELAVEVSASPGKEGEGDSDLDVGPSVPAWVKAKESKSNDWEDDSETQKSEKSAALVKEKEEMKERVKNKLKEKSTDGPNKKMKTVKGDQAQKNSIEDQKEEEEEEEYYLGKERHDERKRKAEEIRKEIRDLKRGVQKEKRAKELEEKEKVEKDEKKKQKTQVLEEFFESQKKYKDNIVVKKGASREQFTMQLLKKFGNKLQTAKEHVNESDEEEKETKGEKTSSVKTQIPKVPEKEDEEEDFNDESWMAHALHCEEKKPILAKDASTKDDDWFEIYDPRNPLNKRRRGENDQKRKDERGSSRRRR